MAGVYVHVPFCHAKCWYCDFYSMPLQPAAEQWLDATLNEWEQRREELDSTLNTLYIGGGTPSSIPIELLSRLIDTLRSPSMKEITVEVNPEDMTRELASALVEHGVNRVSMGVQSLIDCELEAVGRRHTAADAINAVATLREAGVKNISLDLIYGLPLQTIDSWQQSVGRDYRASSRASVGLLPELRTGHTAHHPAELRKNPRNAAGGQRSDVPVSVPPIGGVRV